MAVFKFKTRGKQNVQGKQKIFFCAHPDDYGRFLDKVTDEILDTLAKENNLNCAFFYLEDQNTERDEEFMFTLQEMNLLVIPVTTRLLTTDNPALDIEFKLAIENHIPVLPIMMEPGLETVFNAKCGDLQFLDPNSRDATAISYDEKLTKYLTSVLVGDELAEKIRTAFDAYIFLSYRKKDRKYAQELMRLIHKNDFCRDIAIWYDEFLTPGENFNDSIKAALEKSKLFALAVTPNLVNEDNYVMTVEYPMAKKTNKLILPAELVETDKKALAEKYDGIPDCVRSDDESALSASLENALEGIALRENDNDPEHNFFIGLAYLGGVDVERYPERALSLITSAAEAGVADAMKKLVSIFRNGELGAPNYKKAIEWQQKLVEYRQSEYEEKQDENSAFQYLNDIYYFGKFILELDCWDDAENIFKKMLDAAKEINEHFGKDWTLKQLADGYFCLGDVYEFRGNSYNPEQSLRKALDIELKVANKNGNRANTENIRKIRDLLDDSEKFPGAHAVAEEYYSMAIAVLEKLATTTGLSTYWRDLALFYERLGDSLKNQSILDRAEAYYLKALDLRIKIADRTNTLDSIRNLSISYDRLGDICLMNGDLDGAEKFYTQSLDIRIKLESITGTIEAIRDLSKIYASLEYLYILKGALDLEEKYSSAAFMIIEKLAKETESADDMRRFANRCHVLGNKCARRNDTEGSIEHHLDEYRFREKVAELTGTKDDVHALWRCCCVLAGCYSTLSKPAYAEKYYLRSIEILANRVSERIAGYTNKDIANLYLCLGDAFKDQESIPEMEKYYKKALEYAEKHAYESDTVKGHDDLARFYYDLALILINYRDNTLKKICIDCINKAVAVWNSLVEREPNCAKYVQMRNKAEFLLALV